MPPLPATGHPLERWQLRLQLQRPLQHTQHPGSLLRGLFGHALRALACQCGSDQHRPDCLYASIFEPAAPEGWPARYQSCPPAFVISADSNDSARQQLDFAFTLLGPATSQRELIWQAWQQVSRHGLGYHQQIPGSLQVSAGHLQPIQRGSRQINLQLTTPLYLKHTDARGQTHPLPAASLRPHDLLLALHRRLSITSALYGVPASLPAVQDWLELADCLSIEHQLNQHHYQRHSSRQQQKMPLTGLTGPLTLTSPTPLPDSLLHAFNLGQWLHIGGKTALGMGGYRVVASHEQNRDERTTRP